jgi:hypothetical protein
VFGRDVGERRFSAGIGTDNTDETACMGTALKALVCGLAWQIPRIADDMADSDGGIDFLILFTSPYFALIKGN